MTTKISDAFELFLMEHKVKRHRELTITFYKQKLTPFINWCTSNGIDTVDQILSKHLTEYQLTLIERELTNQTQKTIIVAIRTFLNFCVSENLITALPKIIIPKVEKKEIKVFTSEEIKKILDVATDNDKLIFLFALDTGIRVSEMANLKRKDVDLVTGEVKIIQGKGQVDRSVYLGAKVGKLLKKSLIKRRDSFDALWVSSDNRPYTYWGLTEVFKRLQRESKIKKCTPHTCRRYFATQMMKNGVNIYIIAKMMGHSNIFTLKFYLNVTDEEIKTAAKKYGIVDGLL